MRQYTVEDYYKKIHRLQDFSILLLHSFLFLGVYFFLEMYVNKKCQIWTGIFWIVSINLIVLLMRHFCHKLFLLLLGHGLLYAVFILFAYKTQYPGKAGTVFCLLVLTACLMESIARWKADFAPSVYYVRWYFFPLPFVLSFYGLYSREDAYQTAAFVLAVALLMGHFWCLYLQGMNDYMDQHMDEEKIPRSSILRMNTKVVLWILAGFLLVLLSAAAFQFDLGFSAMGRFLAGFFRMLILGMQQFIHAVSWWNHSDREAPERLMEEAVRTAEPSASGEGDVSNLYVALGVMVCLVIFFYMVYRLAHAFDDRDNRKWIPPEFGGRLRTDDQIEDLRGKEGMRFHFFRTNREKIRYQFKKRVKKNIKGTIPKAYTAWELNGEVQKKRADESMTALTGLYNVARYGEREITSAEVKQFRR